MLTNWDHIDDLFQQGLDLAPEARPAWLATLAGDVRDPVARLLAASEASTGAFAEARQAAGAVFAEGQALSDGVTDAEQRLGERMGPYRLESVLGAGGMGTVYLAERADGLFDRHVAIKLVQASRQRAQLHARFERERYILAQLQHPNIAQLLDGGLTDDGIPYLVMEYVDGVSLTTYCTEKQLGLADRLRLFGEVCDAVQHAHQNLVIHRDLKPSNILVTAEGTVKLLDFGIAKLLQSTDASAYASPVALTLTGLPMLTPAYASPEQVKGEALTTASDVYALGVVLYELLVGIRPFDVPTENVHEWARLIVEAPPTRPSLAIAKGDTRTSSTENADAREIHPFPTQLLKGDLDSIILAALAKAPERRYPTVNALADDLQRYLAGEPVSVQADSAWYVSGKLLRRHARPLGAALLLFVLALSFGVYHIVSVNHARALAEQRAQEATLVAEVLEGVLVDFSPATRAGATLDTSLVTPVLASLERRVMDRMDTQPRLQAMLLLKIADLHHAHASYHHAQQLYEHVISLGDAHPEAALDSLINAGIFGLGKVLLSEGQVDSAATILSSTLRQRQARGHGPVSLAQAYRWAAASLLAQGHTEEARRMYHSGLTLLKQAGVTSVAINGHLHSQLGRLQRLQGELDSALVNLSSARNVHERIYTPRHPGLGALNNQIGHVYLQMGEYDKAEASLLEALDIQKQHFPAAHTRVLKQQTGLIKLYMRQDRFADAEQLLREVLVHTEQHERMGAHSWHAHHLANVLQAQGQHAEALRWYALSWDDERQASPSRSRRLAQYPLCHAHALAHLGRLDEARDLLEEGLLFAVADEEKDEYRAALQSLDASGAFSACAYAVIHKTR